MQVEIILVVPRTYYSVVSNSISKKYSLLKNYDSFKYSGISQKEFHIKFSNLHFTVNLQLFSFQNY